MPGARSADPGEINTGTLAEYCFDEDAAWQLLERWRWADGRPVCPHCGAIGEATYLAPQAGTRKTRTGNATHRRVWKCGACRQQFSALLGTVMEDSKIPLSKWLLAIHLMSSGKNRISALQLHRQFHITYKSAWFMAHRLRSAMAPETYAERKRSRG